MGNVGQVALWVSMLSASTQRRAVAIALLSVMAGCGPNLEVARFGDERGAMEDCHVELLVGTPDLMRPGGALELVGSIEVEFEVADDDPFPVSIRDDLAEAACALGGDTVVIAESGGPSLGPPTAIYLVGRRQLEERLDTAPTS